MFDSLAEQTKTRIVYEYGKQKKCKAGEVVCQWHKRSTWNYKGYHIYKSYKPVIKSFADEAAKESAEQDDEKEKEPCNLRSRKKENT